MNLPGSIQEAGFGDCPSADTLWTGAIKDKSLFSDLRVLPSPDLSGIRVMAGWSPALAAALDRGESVWLRLKPRDIATRIQAGFSSIFWNTPWTRGQAPHTLGILCDPAHPALAEFPTAFHSDVQWWSILRHAAPMELDRLGWTDGGLVSLVPDWNDPKPLSIVFEARVGRGRVLVTSVDFDAADDPALRQFESSLLRYWLAAPLPDRPPLTIGRLLTLLEYMQFLEDAPPPRVSELPTVIPDCGWGRGGGKLRKNVNYIR